GRRVRGEEAAHRFAQADRVVAATLYPSRVGYAQPVEEPALADEALRPEGGVHDQQRPAAQFVPAHQVRLQLGQHLVLARLASENYGKLPPFAPQDRACYFPRHPLLVWSQPPTRPHKPRKLAYIAISPG